MSLHSASAIPPRGQEGVGISSRWRPPHPFLITQRRPPQAAPRLDILLADHRCQTPVPSLSSVVNLHGCQLLARAT